MSTNLSNVSLRAGTIYQVILDYGGPYVRFSDEDILEEAIDVKILLLGDKYNTYEDKEGRMISVLVENEARDPEEKMHTMRYSTTRKTLEAGAEYSTGGEFKILDKDIQGVEWVDSDDKYDAYVLPDGTWAYTRGEVPFPTGGVIKQGTEYNLSEGGDTKVMAEDVAGCTWIKSTNSHDIFDLPNGDRIYIRYSLRS